MKEKKLLWIIIFNGIIILSEIIFGFISNSFALIADALHNTGDVIAIVITLIALKLGTKTTTFKYTFGFLKAEMMAAFVNTLFLFLTIFYMIYESINRLFHPEIIEPIYMISVGIIAVIANGISAYILNNMGVSACPSGHDHTHHHHEEDANIKSAYLHMLSDALISVGVVVTGIFIYFFKIYHLDSVLTILFSLYILKHSYPLLKKSFLSLIDANTINISEDKLKSIIKKDDRVLEYHDLHIYKPSSKHHFISFHIVLNNESYSLKECESMTDTIKRDLKYIGFNHILIQVDSQAHIKNQTNCDINKEH
ncbi:Cobalt-zinc-cadmium resistance protein CzcD [hydrothermal vent metagenome]|uniref:Cobalt-zinc-cadmium resistance protein CzcD n=1 Tax=hydrothermal vent metagenome TaxID=652676 RepID=A0A1W1CAX5_9ZZZZ